MVCTAAGLIFRMNQRALFLFNPAANGGKAALFKNELQAKISARFPGAELISTKKDSSFWSEISNELYRFDLLVACGGDGTVHRAGNLAANSNLPLGIIPLGNGNDFANVMNIPRNPDQALKLLKTMQTRFVDLIKIQGDINCWCLNTLGIGLDGLTNQITETLKPSRGPFAYLGGLLKAIGASQPFTVNLRKDENGIISDTLLMLTVCNGFREGGAFIVAPKAKIDDGKAELLRIRPSGIGMILFALPQFLVHPPTYLKTINLTSFRKLTFESDAPQPIHIDGEYAGQHIQNLSMELISRRLEVITRQP